MDRNALLTLKNQMQNPDFLSVGWVRGHLGLIAAIEQEYRNQMIAASTKDKQLDIHQEWTSAIQDTISPDFEKIDEVSSHQLQRILDANGGWQPFLRKMDSNVIEHAFIITQHADHNREFQMESLKEWNKNDIIDVSNKGYLEDRLRVNHFGKPQIYGTQGDLAGGFWHPYICELKTVEEVDTLRLERQFNQLNGINPLTLSNYFKLINNRYAPEKEHPPITFLPLPKPEYYPAFL